MLGLLGGLLVKDLVGGVRDVVGHLEMFELVIQLTKFDDEDGEGSAYGTNIEDFTGMEEEEGELYLFDSEDSPRGIEQESGPQLDQFEAFLGPPRENEDDDVFSKYTPSDELHSCNGFDNDGAPRRRKYPEFILNDMHVKIFCRV